MVAELDRLQARVERLEQLAKGLAREVARWKRGDDPLLFAERRAYVDGILDALAGMDEARTVLVGVLARLRRSRRPPASP
jgi:hypothetical protein